MKILQLIKTAVGATWALRQTRELAGLGVEVHVAMPDGPLVEKYRSNGIIVHISDITCSLQKPWNWPGQTRKLKTLVEEIEPDLVHSHFVGTTLAMRIGLRGMPELPRIFQVPGPLHLEHVPARWLELGLAQGNDYWIASCEWTRRYYRKSGIAPKRIFLSYYGMDIENFRPRDPGKLRRELELDPDVRTVGIVAYMYAPKRYLGQTRGLKGHEDLVDAVAMCRDRGMNLVCVLVGGAWEGATSYEKHVRNYAREKCGDAAVCLGTRNDVVDLYPGLDLVVHPSHSDNVGGAVESLLLGRPTITSRVGGFPDLVKENKTGYLVPPKNPKALADKIEYVLSHYDEAKRLAENGRLLCREMFDIRKNARDVLGAYKSILDKH